MPEFPAETRVRNADASPRHTHDTAQAKTTITPDHPILACERYFRAIRARDVEAVLEAMTPDYGAALRAMRREPDFAAFFALWCETQGRLAATLASTIDGDEATVMLDAGNSVLNVRLRRIERRWLIEAEDVQSGRSHRSVLAPG